MAMKSPAGECMVAPGRAPSPAAMPSASAPLFAGDRLVSASYAAAHFGKSLFWHAGELLLAFFLTEIAGLAPRAMAAVLALSLVASAASDLLIGQCLRRTLSRLQGACGLQLLGAVVSALTLVGLFSTAQLPAPMRLSFALCMAVGFKIGYSLYDTPQNVLLSLATPDADSRARATAMRIAVSGIAGLGAALAVAPLLARDGGLDQSTRCVLLTMVLASIAVATAAALRLAMRRYAHAGAAPSAQALPAAPSQGAPPPLWPLLGMVFVVMLTTPIFGKLQPYFAAYVLGSPGWGGALLAASALGTIVSQPLWYRLAGGWDRRQAVVGFATALLACAVGWASVVRSPTAAVVCASLLGMASGGLAMTLWAGFAEAAARRDPLRIGLAYGMLTATSKLSLALGALLLGTLLAGFDYRDRDSDRLLWLMALGPALGAGGCLCFAWAWRSPPGHIAVGER